MSCDCVPEEAIYETIRTLNTHLTRVEVLTYKELVDNAERSIGGAAHPKSAYGAGPMRTVVLGRDP
jgi:hypothetical protein